MQPPGGSSLCLIGEFGLRIDGADEQLSLRCQQLLALLALRDRPVERRSMCAALWPDEPLDRSRKTLRTAIWRLRHHHDSLVMVDGNHVRLNPGLEVDVRRAMKHAREAIEYGQLSPDLDPHLLAHDLLEDWDDEWVLLERERFRQLRMHALEAISIQLTRRGDHSMAVAASLDAISAEPFRESAHRTLIAAFIAEGNLVEAVRQFQRFRELSAELGIVPSPQLTAMLSDLVPVSSDGMPVPVPSRPTRLSRAT
jgi:DNA-binding SARP family transcriptional activator